MMELLLKFSREHPSLPRAELLAVLEERHRIQNLNEFGKREL